MQYGHFDDANKEYVVDRPDTPKSWSNYLGTAKYGAIITNNAGGYGFYRSADRGRFMRLRFNAIPMDQPGRYFYIRDKEDGDYWSASWQPVGKPLEEYKTICRHGTAYTVIDSEYKNIRTETTYFVPLEQEFEYWHMKITNNSTKPRKLSIFTYAEFAMNWWTRQDMINLQYGAYTARTDWMDNMIRIASIDHVPPKPESEFVSNDQGRWCWFTLTGADIQGFESNREAFIGPYRTYANPIAVEKGECTGSVAHGDNPCATIQGDIELAPGESKDIMVLMGIGKVEEEGNKIFAEYGTPQKAEEELKKVKAEWHSRLNNLVVQTPDADFDHMINVWNAYNAMMTLTWSRAASLVYSGERDGLGYRDSVQDIMGGMINMPELSKERLEMLITGQCSTGGAMSIVKPFDHTPGKMQAPDESQYRSDDCMWLFNSIDNYVAESGDVDFYNKVLPYADKGEATVLGHLRRAIEFNLERRGAHGIPCGLLADWNDCIEFGADGESVFVLFQLRYGLNMYIRLCEIFDKADEVKWAREQMADIDKVIQEHTWDGDYFLRGYCGDGSILGSHTEEEGAIFLNPQSWSVLSGAATEEQAIKAMDAVKEKLATEYGIMVCAPPFIKKDYHVVRAVLMNEGSKENAGIFSHPQGWAVMAECMLGRGDRAMEFYRAFMPAAQNDKAEIREIEPYVHCQSTHSIYSRQYGVSRIPWLSGTASWSYYSAIAYILGLRPEYDGFTIDPCVPSSWKSFKMQRKFRGKNMDILVENPNGAQKGVKEMIVNGEKIEGSFIPLEKLQDQNDIKVVMG